MSPFQFSLSKIHKYQKQKMELAEIQIRNCKTRFDEALGHLRQLNRRIDQAAAVYQAPVAGEIQTVLSHRNHLEALRVERTQALQHVEAAAAAWRQAVTHGREIQSRLEGYEVILQAEKADYVAEQTRAETNELMDVVLHKWQLLNGEHSND